MRAKILHIVPSLGQGGAERVLASLLSSQRPELDHHVVSLLAEDPFFRFEALTVETLGLMRESSLIQAVGTVHRLRRYVNSIRPDLVHGWLYHGNAFTVGAVGLGIPILWSIHNTTLSATSSKRSTRLLNRVCAALSGWVPKRILYCSEAARSVHEQSGYVRSRSVVVYNGVDLAAFRFDAQRRSTLRAALELAENEFAIAAIGRFDQQKNHDLIAKAFALVARSADARLLLAGAGCSPDNTDLLAMLEARGISNRSVLLGPRHDMDALLSACDVVVIGSSYGEALPMIAIEAASAGLPIVAVDIGDVARFAEQPDDVVPRDDADAMSRALLRVQARRTRRVRQASLDEARARMLEPYSLESMSRAYLDLYRGLIGRGAALACGPHSRGPRKDVDTERPSA
jgi:glycosyltransferase involved in cell wall biosynthesis